MPEESEIFEKHYQDYCQRTAELDFSKIREILAVEHTGETLHIPLFGEPYLLSRNGITDEQGQRPPYGLCVILFKYVLHCPHQVYTDLQWAAFRDFKREAHATNINFFSSDTDQAIRKHFQGNLAALEKACQKTGGKPHDVGSPYDLSMEFAALPRISLLLLFNDTDEEFPSRCQVLFQKHAEYYLDPESLAITGALLAKRLIRASEHRTVPGRT